MLDDHSWYKRRNYPHFDASLRKRRATNLVTNPDRVASHPFFPFIKRIQFSRRFRFDKKQKRGIVKRKRRPICYAAHADAHIYAYYAQQLGQRYEAYIADMPFDACVTAYRSLDGKCNIHFAKEAFDAAESLAPCVVLAFDIKGFFDTLNHRLLKKAWGDLLDSTRLPPDHYNIYRSLIRFAYVREKRLQKLFADFFALPDYKKRGRRICTIEDFRENVRGGGYIQSNPRKGIPQGSPISALLSNVYMMPFDEVVHKTTSKRGGIYRRYSDDLIVICPPQYADEIESCVMSHIGDRRLEIQKAKTERYLFEKDETGALTCRLLDNGKPSGLQYLGFVFDGQRRLIRSSSLMRYYRRMKRAVYHTVKQAQKTPANKPDSIVRRRRLYERFSHLGKRNFIDYARRAAQVMEDDSIRYQVKQHWDKLNDEIDQQEKAQRSSSKKTP